MPKELPPVDLLRKLLRYEPDTGKLFWRKRTHEIFMNSGYGGAVGVCARWNGKHANMPALSCLDAQGYLHGRVLGKLFKAHRICWSIYFGVSHFSEIDHINGNTSDNRIANLREVSDEQNAKNAKIRKDNKTGHQGIYKQGPIWRAQIGGSKNRIHLGCFSSIDEAINARERAKQKLSYHKNHGRIV